MIKILCNNNNNYLIPLYLSETKQFSKQFVFKQTLCQIKRYSSTFNTKGSRKPVALQSGEIIPTNGITKHFKYKDLESYL